MTTDGTATTTGSSPLPSTTRLSSSTGCMTLRSIARVPVSTPRWPTVDWISWSTPLGRTVGMPTCVGSCATCWRSTVGTPGTQTSSAKPSTAGPVRTHRPGGGCSLDRSPGSGGAVDLLRVLGTERPRLPGLDDPERDVAELGVGVLRRPDEELERPLTGEVVALHHDADGLADGLAAVQRHVEVL